MTAVTSEPKGFAYPYAGCEVIDISGKVGTGRHRRWLQRWLVHSKSEAGVWYVLEALHGHLSCSCPHGQVVHGAWLESNNDENRPTLERQRQLDKRLSERCAHMRARDAFVALATVEDAVVRPEAAPNVGIWE